MRSMTRDRMLPEDIMTKYPCRVKPNATHPQLLGDKARVISSEARAKQPCDTTERDPN